MGSDPDFSLYVNPPARERNLRKVKDRGQTPFTLLTCTCIALLAGCAAAAEDHLLRTYFDTCAIADRTALSNMAIVAFDPGRDGVVGHFRVTRRSPVRIEPVIGGRSFDDPTAARIVSLSLLDPQRPRDPSGARLVLQTLDLDADVYRGSGSEQQVLNVMLARAETPRDTGRWIVVRLVRGARISPAASSGRPTQTAP